MSVIEGDTMCCSFMCPCTGKLASAVNTTFNAMSNVLSPVSCADLLFSTVTYQDAGLCATRVRIWSHYLRSIHQLLTLVLWPCESFQTLLYWITCYVASILSLLFA